MEQEIWKDIIRYEGLYQISNFGRIRNSNSDMKPYTISNGNKVYLGITLVKEGVKKRYRVHRVVAEHFIDNPFNLSQVNHKDNNAFNNNVDNLEWVSHRENQSHRSLNSGNKTSKYVGVSKSGNRWRAQICIWGNNISLGSYDTEDDAYAARVKYTNDNNIFDKYLKYNLPFYINATYKKKKL